MDKLEQDVKALQTPFAKGKEARAEGMLADANPYHPGTPHHINWNTGYFSAACNAVYRDESYCFNLADVLYFDINNHGGGWVILKYSYWNNEGDYWDRAPYFGAGIDEVIKAWEEFRR